MERCQCPICGGTLEISLLSGEAVCEACGNRARVDFDRTAEYRRIYHEAEKAACLNTAAGYAEAIELLESISFVKEAKLRALIPTLEILTLSTLDPQKVKLAG